MHTIVVTPAKQWFSNRRQWRFQIRAGNNTRLSDRDTYANVGDIRRRPHRPDRRPRGPRVPRSPLPQRHHRQEAGPVKPWARKRIGYADYAGQSLNATVGRTNTALGTRCARYRDVRPSSRGSAPAWSRSTPKGAARPTTRLCGATNAAGRGVASQRHRTECAIGEASC